MLSKKYHNIAIAVGMPVTSTPRTDPYMKNYLIRLLPLVTDTKSLRWIRVFNCGGGNQVIASFLIRPQFSVWLKLVSGYAKRL